MKISIIIPTYNRCQDLKQCLESILRQDFDSNDLEIIVVDNGPSHDKTKEYMRGLCKNYENIKWIKTSRQGVTYARELGSRKAKNEIILQLDDDVKLVNVNTLKTLVNLFYKNPDYDCIAGLDLKDFNRISPPINIGKIDRYGVVHTNFSGINSLTKQEIEIDHARTCFLAYRKSIFYKVNGFDCTYDDLTKGIGFRGETDFCYKIKKNSGKIVLSKRITFLHRGAERPKGIPKRGKGLKHFFYVYLAHSFFVFKNLKINKIKWVLFQIFFGDYKVPGLFYILKRKLNPVLFLFLPLCIFKAFLLSINYNDKEYSNYF